MGNGVERETVPDRDLPRQGKSATAVANLHASGKSVYGNADIVSRCGHTGHGLQIGRAHEELYEDATLLSTRTLIQVLYGKEIGFIR